MSRLIPCPACAAHVLVAERRCPHCGTTLRTVAAPVTFTVLLGLTLAACPGDDSGDGSDTVGATTNPTSSTTAIGPSSTTEDSLSGSGGVEYGTPDTGIDSDTTGSTGTGTGTGTDTTSSGSTSLGEPEYGVAESSG